MYVVRRTPKEANMPPAKTRQVEIWETTTPSSFRLFYTDPKGYEKPLRVGGKVGARLRITTEDRELNQERFVSPDLDPFLNGFLVQAQGPVTLTSPHAVANDDLVTWYQREDFDEAIEDLNEFNSYRLLRLSDAGKATVKQVETLRDMIQRRWPITSGDTPTYRELKAIGTLDGATGQIMVR